MRKIVAILTSIAMMTAQVANSQTVPNGTISQGQQWTVQQWNSAWASKQDLLSFTPLNPVNNLSDLNNLSTARNNLGLGTGATANLGTSGSALCLTNTGCTWTAQQVFQQGINTTSITGLSQPLATNVGGIGTANGDVSGLTVTSTGTTASSSLAAHFARQIWVTDFDPSACSSINYDSSAAFNAAVQWMVTHGPGVIMLPQGTCKLGNATFPVLTLGPGVSLQGAGTNATFIAAGLTNANPLIRMGGNGDVISNLTINAATTGTNTTGITIQLGTPGSPNVIYQQQIISNVAINGPCIGIDMSGGSLTVKDTSINGYAGTGCGGIRVGNLTTGGLTTNVFLTNVNLISSSATPADYNVLLLDVGTPVFQNVTTLNGKFGMEITPGAGQFVQWGSFLSSQLGDLNTNQALFINPTSSTGSVIGLRFMDDWFCCNTVGDLNIIQNSNNGTVKDVEFNHTYFLRSPGNTLTIGTNVGGVQITGGSLFCVYNSSGINLQGGASGVSIVGNKSSPSCVGQSGTGTTAINFGGSNNSLVITDNDFTGNSATLPFIGIPSGNNIVVGRNLSIDNNPVTLTNAAMSGNALDLSQGGTTDALATTFNLTVTSGSTISTISNAGWQGRQFNLINSTGGNLTVGGGTASSNGVTPTVGKTLSNGDMAVCTYTGTYTACH